MKQHETTTLLSDRSADPKIVMQICFFPRLLRLKLHIIHYLLATFLEKYRKNATPERREIKYVAISAGMFWRNWTGFWRLDAKFPKQLLPEINGIFLKKAGVRGSFRKSWTALLVILRRKLSLNFTATKRVVSFSKLKLGSFQGQGAREI